MTGSPGDLIERRFILETFESDFWGLLVASEAFGEDLRLLKTSEVEQIKGTKHLCQTFESNVVLSLDSIHETHLSPKLSSKTSWVIGRF